jgi:hypothetical protein
MEQGNWQCKGNRRELDGIEYNDLQRVRWKHTEPTEVQPCDSRHNKAHFASPRSTKLRNSFLGSINLVVEDYEESNQLTARPTVITNRLRQASKRNLTHLNLKAPKAPLGYLEAINIATLSHDSKRRQRSSARTRSGGTTANQR